MPDKKTLTILEQAKINRLNALCNMSAIEEYLDGLSPKDKRQLTIWAHMELYFDNVAKYHEDISEWLVWDVVKEWCILSCWNIFQD